jgi:hypothetical protein
MPNQKKFLPVLFIIFLVTSLLGNVFIFSSKVSAARDITFPVIGNATFSDDYNAPRDGGARIHHAIDILAKKGSPLVSVIDGTITDVQYPQPSWGYSVSVKDASGYEYSYLHMNDDNPGTNDGKGGPMNAYTSYVKEGNHVIKGQLLGRVGDSGHANGISHLHFEMRKPDGTVINPHTSLVRAHHISRPTVPPAIGGELLPYNPSFSGGINVAMGNFDGDQSPELVTGAGKGGGPHVKVFETDNTNTAGFFAYNSTFRGGVDVATGDVDGDGTDEIITGAGPGGGPHVKIFQPDGTPVGGFFAYDSKGRTGIKVTAGDVDGDGTDEIITAPMSGTPLVKVFSMSGSNVTLVKSFYAYKAAFPGGVDVASGDVSGTNSDEIISVPLSGGSPQVKVFTGTGTNLSSFYAFNSNFKGGSRISVGNVVGSSPKSEILAVPASNAGPVIKMFTGTGTQLSSRAFLESWWIGSYDIAAGTDTSRLGTGVNRRVSIHLGIE